MNREWKWRSGTLIALLVGVYFVCFSDKEPVVCPSPEKVTIEYLTEHLRPLVVYTGGNLDVVPTPGRKPVD